jgi:adenylosuccinate synthase
MGKRSYVVAGLHFGDEGKGTIVDFLAREKENPIIVKCGGPQAAHNVVTPEGLHHTFAQLGSGMFVEGARTVLSQHMYVEPLAFMFEHKIFEEKVKRDITKDIYIDGRCCIVTPYQKIVGRLVAKSLGRSTCGMGVGMAVDDRRSGLHICMRDIPKTDLLRKKLGHVIDYNKDKLHRDIEFHINVDDIIKMYEEFYETYQIIDTTQYIYGERFGSTLIYEGSQGSLLVPNLGFAPHISKATITSDVMYSDARNVYTSPIIIGVMRSYSHRHGVGPFPMANTADIPESYNTNNEWQGQFRTGLFDPVLLKYVLDRARVDSLAVTHLDRFPGAYPLCDSYLYDAEITNMRDFGRHMSWRKRFGEVEVTNMRRHEVRTGEYLDRCRLSINRYNDYIIEDADEFLKYLESIFKKKIAISSYGPCATDKRWLQNV